MTAARSTPQQALSKPRSLFERSGVEITAQRRATARTNFDVTPLTDAIIQKQQSVADRFARVHLIPAPVRVADLIWAWKPS